MKPWSIRKQFVGTKTLPVSCYHELHYHDLSISSLALPAATHAHQLVSHKQPPAITTTTVISPLEPITPLHGHRLQKPATDTANGQAHDNSTTNLSHRNARVQHLDMSRCWDVANFCPLVRCPCSGVWLLARQCSSSVLGSRLYPCETGSSVSCHQRVHAPQFPQIMLHCASTRCP